MRRAQGYFEITDPALPYGKSEEDTIQCAHCGGHFSMSPKKDPTLAHGYCGRCNHFICSACAARMDLTLQCAPFEQWLELQEARDRFHRTVFS